jgi:hypothetical protein
MTGAGDGECSTHVLPTKGLPGTAVKVSGANFANGETVTVVYLTGLFAPKPSRVRICTATTTAGGAFCVRGQDPCKRSKAPEASTPSSPPMPSATGPEPSST